MPEPAQASLDEQALERFLLGCIERANARGQELHLLLALFFALIALEDPAGLFRAQEFPSPAQVFAHVRIRRAGVIPQAAQDGQQGIAWGGEYFVIRMINFEMKLHLYS